MWIIPKNLSMYRSAQDTGALISDSQELSELCAQSLLWRSKPSQPSTWSKRLKPGTLMSALSSQTLKPSHGSSIVGEWISSQEASLVSHLAQPADEQETATLDTCGPTLPTQLDAWGTLPLFSWKTSRGSSAASSQAQSGQTQRVRPFSCMSSESWRGWVIKQRREYSARARSVRPISESGCLSWGVAPISARQGEGLSMRCSGRQSEGEGWPTPTLVEYKLPHNLKPILRRVKIKKQIGLIGTIILDHHGPRQEAQSSTHGSHQESRWATPTARDWKGPQGRAYKNQSLDLPAQAWATPTARDYKGFYPKWCQESESKRTRSQLPDQAHRGTYKGQLNPRWVETLMGLPVGWVMPSCADPWIIAQTSCECSEMELCQQQQSEPLESYGETLEQVLGPDIMRRFNELTESLEIPDDDAEANMFALEMVLNNRDNPNE